MEYIYPINHPVRGSEPTYGKDYPETLPQDQREEAENFATRLLEFADFIQKKIQELKDQAQMSGNTIDDNPYYSQQIFAMGQFHDYFCIRVFNYVHLPCDTDYALAQTQNFVDLLAGRLLRHLKTCPQHIPADCPIYKVTFTKLSKIYVELCHRKDLLELSDINTMIEDVWNQLPGTDDASEDNDDASANHDVNWTPEQIEKFRYRSFRNGSTHLLKQLLAKFSLDTKPRPPYIDGTNYDVLKTLALQNVKAMTKYVTGTPAEGIAAMTDEFYKEVFFTVAALFKQLYEWLLVSTSKINGHIPAHYWQLLSSGSIKNQTYSIECEIYRQVYFCMLDGMKLFHADPMKSFEEVSRYEFLLFGWLKHKTWNPELNYLKPTFDLLRKRIGDNPMEAFGPTVPGEQIPGSFREQLHQDWLSAQSTASPWAAIARLTLAVEKLSTYKK